MQLNDEANKTLAELHEELIERKAEEQTLVIEQVSYDPSNLSQPSIYKDVDTYVSYGFAEYN